VILHKQPTIYAVINQKGGVGKTTTAAALWAGLTSKGYRVLAVDLDAQANLSFNAGAGIDGVTSLELLTKEATAAEAVQHTQSGDIIPASRALAGTDSNITETGKEYRLKEALEPIKGEYDFIILDTPPALGILTVNALTACTSVIIPAQADIFSLQGIEQLAGTIEPVKRYCNSDLNIAGIVLTRYSSRSILSKEVAELAQQLAEKLGTRLFKATIREAISVKEAQISQQSIFDYAGKSNVAADYIELIEELLTSTGKPSAKND
jgi:chromosome partitioning protein